MPQYMLLVYQDEVDAAEQAVREQTLPLFVYSEFQSSLDASVAAGAVLVVAALTVLVVVRLLGGRSVTTMRSLT